MKSFTEYLEEKATSQLAGNLLSLMSNDKNYKDVKKSMELSIKSSPFFHGKSKKEQERILSDIGKARNVNDFEIVSKRHNLESMLVT